MRRATRARKGSKGDGDAAAGAASKQDSAVSAPARFDMLAAQMQRLRTEAVGPPPVAQHGATGRYKSRSSSLVDPGGAALDEATHALDDLDAALDSEAMPWQTEAPTPVPAGTRNTGAYRFTSLAQKLQRWRMLTTRAQLELDKPPKLPAAAADPLWVQTRLDKAWVSARDQLEEILKGGAAIISIAQYAAAARKAGSLDYTMVEEQMMRILKSMVPLVTTVQVAAALVDTPGVGRNLIRRTKGICKGVAKLMEVLENPAGSAPVICTQILEVVGGLEGSVKMVLKVAYKGAEDARKAEVEEEARMRQAERRRKIQEKKDELAKQQSKRQADLAAIRKQREAADRELEEAKHMCEQQSKEGADRIRRIRAEAEAQFIADAVQGKSVQLREKLQPPDLSVDGFEHSPEGIYDTGTAVKAGFTTDTRAFAAADSEAEKQKQAYIERLRVKHAAATAAAEDENDSDEF